MLPPEKYDAAPVNLVEAKKELYDLKKTHFNFRRSHWVFWWGFGVIFCGTACCFYHGLRFILLLTGAVVFTVLTILTWKGIINPSINRGSTDHEHEDQFLRRIAFLEGYIQSKEQNRGPLV